MRQNTNEELRTTATPTALASGGVVGVLAAAAVIAGGTQAYAEVVRFDNPAGAGHFDWAGGGPPAKWLDVTMSAASQAGAGGPTAFLQQFYPTYVGLVATNGALAIGDPYGISLQGLSAGDIVSGASNWYFQGYFYIAGYPLNFSEGQAVYLGVRLSENPGGQYGWIGVVMQADQSLDAFAWGYETIPGVPIAAGVPAPGTLALLAFGAAAGATRSRRKDN